MKAVWIKPFCRIVRAIFIKPFCKTKIAPTIDAGFINIKIKAQSIKRKEEKQERTAKRRKLEIRNEHLYWLCQVISAVTKKAWHGDIKRILAFRVKIKGKDLDLNLINQSWNIFKTFSKGFIAYFMDQINIIDHTEELKSLKIFMGSYLNFYINPLEEEVDCKRMLINYMDPAKNTICIWLELFSENSLHNYPCKYIWCNKIDNNFYDYIINSIGHHADTVKKNQ